MQKRKLFVSTLKAKGERILTVAKKAPRLRRVRSIKIKREPLSFSLLLKDESCS